MRLMPPKTRGNMRVIVFCWLACWASIAGDCVIFCCTYMVSPERATRKKARGLPASNGWMARSIPRNWRFTGTTVSSTGSQL